MKYGVVFALRVQVFIVLRVSRYNAGRKQVTSHGIVILLTVLARSGFITGYKSVMAAGLEAKTMTSLLILPALLVKVQFFFVMQYLS